MLVIRLTRVGKKNSPAYRVVVADKRKAVKRKFIEIIGHYNPTMNPKQLVIDKDKALSWIKQGAQPSDTVNNLMCDLEILPKSKKIKKVYGKPNKKKDDGKNTEEIKPETDKSVETENEEVVPEAEETPATSIEQENSEEVSEDGVEKSVE